MKDSNLFKVFQMGGYTPTNLENFQYLPTYVGKPLEAQKMVGDRMVELFNTNLAQASAVDIMNGQRQVIDEDREDNEQISARYKQELEEIAKSGDYENMTMRVNALARKYQTDPDVRALTESRANWDRREKMAEEIRMKTGRDPLFMSTPGRTIGYDENGKKIYNIFRSTAEAPLDWQAKRQEIWSVVQPNMGQLSKDQVRKVLADIPGYIATGTWRGISGGENGKIAQLLDEAVSAYEGTPEYRQEVRYLQETEPDKDAEQIVKTRILKEGLLKTFSQVDPQYMKDWILEDQLQKLGAGDAIPQKELMPALKLKSVLGFDPDDNLEGLRVDEGFSTSPHSFNMFGGADIAQHDSYIGKKRGVPEAEVKARNEAAIAAVSIFAGPEAAKQAVEQGSDFYNSKEAQKLVEQYAELVETRYQFPEVQPYGEPQSKEATFQLTEFINSRMVLDLSDPDAGPIPTSDGGNVTPEFMDLIGGKTSNLTVSGYVEPKNSYGKIAGDPRFADAQVVSVKDEKGETQKQLLITRPAGYYTTPKGQAKAMLNTLWNNLALNPGKVQNITVAGIELQAQAVPDVKDPSGSGDRLLVYKLGPMDFTQHPKGYAEVASYEELINKLFALQD